MPYADPVKRRAKAKFYSARWQKNNPEKVREKAARYYQSKGREKALQRNYGLTNSEVEWMKVEQDGRCEICQKDISQKPCVDHNHRTGKVRRLLCYRCNVGLATFETPGWAEAAARYLKIYA